jgi:hypothetical protein
VGDGTDAGLGGERVVALEALAHVAELGRQDCRRGRSDQPIRPPSAA